MKENGTNLCHQTSSGATSRQDFLHEPELAMMVSAISGNVSATTFMFPKISGRFSPSSAVQYAVLNL